MSWGEQMVGQGFPPSSHTACLTIQEFCLTIICIWAPLPHILPTTPVAHYTLPELLQKRAAEVTERDIQPVSQMSGLSGVLNFKAKVKRACLVIKFSLGGSGFGFCPVSVYFHSCQVVCMSADMYGCHLRLHWVEIRIQVSSGLMRNNDGGNRHVEVWVKLQAPLFCFLGIDLAVDRCKILI